MNEKLPKVSGIIYSPENSDKQHDFGQFIFAISADPPAGGTGPFNAIEVAGFLETDGKQLLLYRKSQNLFEFHAAERHLQVKRSFLTGKWCIIEGVTRVPVKGQSTLPKHIPFSELTTNPIEASLQWDDSELLKLLRKFGLESRFGEIAPARKRTPGDIASIGKEVDNASRNSAIANGMLCLGVILFALGFGYFVLPDFGLQFKIMKAVTPSGAGVTGVVGVILIGAALVLGLRSNRRKH